MCHTRTARQVSDCTDGGFYTSSVAAAASYAVAMGAHVVLCSFGPSIYSQGFDPSFPAPGYHAAWAAAYDEALRPLSDAGVLLVASAGAMTAVSGVGVGDAAVRQWGGASRRRATQGVRLGQTTVHCSARVAPPSDLFGMQW